MIHSRFSGERKGTSMRKHFEAHNVIYFLLERARLSSTGLPSFEQFHFATGRSSASLHPTCSQPFLPPNQHQSLHPWRIYHRPRVDRRKPMMHLPMKIRSISFPNLNQRWDILKNLWHQKTPDDYDGFLGTTPSQDASPYIFRLGDPNCILGGV